jgi:hypothetical protein
VNAEGVAPIITAEWLQTVLTSVPMVVLGAWCVYGPILLWRRQAWEESGGEMRAVAARWQGELSPWLGGWRVRAADRQVRWAGGLSGPRTVVIVGSVTLHADEGWLTADQVDALF